MQINSVVLETNAVDTEVQNIFNQFRLLSNMQFMENVRSRVTATPY